MRSNTRFNFPALVSATFCTVAAALVSVGSPLAAQVAPEPTRLQASRAELERVVASPGATSAADVEIIRRRLAQGDFQPNDRVVVRVFGEATLTDTFTVRPGPQLELPALAPLPLAGVLRSELEGKVRTHVARYIKDPQVTAYGLIRIGLLGGVVRPGFYNVPADLDLSQILLAGGGLSTDADLKKATISRNGVQLYSAAAVESGFSAGKSPDQLNLASGDALDIGRRNPNKAGQTIGIISLFVGLGTTAIFLLRR